MKKKKGFQIAGWLWFLAGLAVVMTAAVYWISSRLPADGNIEVIYDRPIQSAPEARQAAVFEPAQTPEPSHAHADLPVNFFNFGQISGNAVVQHDFLIVNRGSSNLLIYSAYTTCGCTTAGVTASLIPPGKAARATVVFDAGYHPAIGQTVQRGLILETNDPDQPRLEIWIRASIR